MTDPVVTEYTVAAFQQDDRNGHHWRVRVCRNIVTSCWTIQHGGYWLGSHGTWHPDHRTALNFADEHDAISRAQAALRGLDINGTTWDDMVSRWGEPS